MWFEVVQLFVVWFAVLCGVAHAVCVQVHTMTGRVVWRARM